VHIILKGAKAMQSPKEIFLELLKPDGKPERQLKQYEGLALFLGDPINGYLRGNRKRGATTLDRWGTAIMWPENAPGPMPHITEENKVCKDITHWRDYVHAPDIEANCTEGWEQCREAARAMAGDTRVLSGFMGTGIFEQCHFLMGFEDTLTNLYEHPQEMHELIDYITDYRIRYVKMLIDNLQPELIFSHDDWGTKDALFMKPEMWREFFKEPYRRFYGYIRSRGVIAVHHADSYLVPIVDDMVEIGIQVWQGVLPENNIPALQQHLQGKLVLMGGIGAAIDRADSTEEEIRSYVKKALNDYCPGGHVIPCITYGLFGTVFPHVDPIIDDEIDKYNSVLHMPTVSCPPVPRRKVAEKTTVTVTVEEDSGSDLLAALSQALCKGQRKKVLQLCQEGIDQGIDAQKLLSDGLVVGMNKLGEDFSSGRAFVPEMLMAARCMSSATELLKPLLTSGNSKVAGRVCIGTVKGDMHDIGKNLVKIMMEGSGIEVVDLGVDVSPEQFVQTAIDDKCSIICCSSLLTTTMNEMRRVVQLAEEKGIRNKVKIMVGGAPISQSFCDEIGADAYTEDAGQAARVAVELLSA
jgi:corrinoid protein of di/trimethylamine methyltransferase